MDMNGIGRLNRKRGPQPLTGIRCKSLCWTYLEDVVAQIPESDQIKQLWGFPGTSNKLTETCFLHFTREIKPEEENHIRGDEASVAEAGLLGQPRQRSAHEWTLAISGYSRNEDSSDRIP
ncbi:mitochondrial import inner membrane translocase subunit Tim9-like [Panthera tigris]|uniref:mitochondrial import inner membrane translocase subunit Tim9-like n=1 Tax=Panthera tigris TaxID=9694 RepID=UPI00076637F2|nr:mitochondrial import inner membrane translocase subunit Tim9-like [Panthera tigris]